MEKQVELLSRAVNFAVVQLPDRKFPGVVFQGDTLHALRSEIDELLKTQNAVDNEEMYFGLLNISEQLAEAAAHYEFTCAQRGISLPYAKD